MFAEHSSIRYCYIPLRQSNILFILGILCAMALFFYLVLSQQAGKIDSFLNRFLLIDSIKILINSYFFF